MCKKTVVISFNGVLMRKAIKLTICKLKGFFRAINSKFLFFLF